MESQASLYNEAYKKFTPDYLQAQNIEAIKKYLNENSESLRQFLDDFVKQYELRDSFKQQNCLELGCGIGSLSFYLHECFKQVICLDHSNLAISSAKSIANLLRVEPYFICADACKVEFDEKFAAIFDSHLLHCITDKKSRYNYLHNMKKHLSEGGRFFIETMIIDKKIEIPIEYYLDENKTLWKGNLAYRKLLSPLEIEQELINAGFEINYFYCHNELSFNPFSEYHSLAHETLPKTLRICVS